MNLKCLTGDLGFAVGIVLADSVIDAGTAKQYISWGLLEETTDKPTDEVVNEPTPQEIAAGVADETPIDDLTDEELAKLTEPETDK
jgi:hypothetical protein